MPVEASAFVNTKPRTCGQLLSHCHHSRDEIWPPEQNNNIFLTSKISTWLRLSRQQVSNTVSLLSMEIARNPILKLYQDYRKQQT